MSQNLLTHGVAIATGVGPRPPGLLRHSSAHRARRRAIEAAKVTIIRADLEIDEMDSRSHSDVVRGLAEWAKRRGGRLMKTESCKVCPSMVHPFGGWLFVQVAEVHGPVTLPTTVNGWKLAKATAKDIAWATRPQS